MITFTKEQLISSAHARIEFAEMMLSGELEPLKERTWSIELELARIALASLEAEPYGYVHKAAYEQAGSCGLSSDHEAYRDSSTHVAVYTAPPAPVSVPDLTALDNLAGEMLNHAMNCERRVAVAYTHCAHRLAEEVRDLRAAMLQGAEPVTTAYKLPEGWVAVPVEPTAEMMAEAKRWTGLTRTAEIVYREMIAAAPQQEVKP